MSTSTQPTPMVSMIQGASIDNWVSISDKTVFVLDKSPYFTHISSGHSIEGDFCKDKKTSQGSEPAIKPFDRSLWTCAVEAVVGYSRLVWDLHTPRQKGIEILTFGPNVNKDAIDKATEPYTIEKICTWREEEQNLDHLLKSLAKKSHYYQVNELTPVRKTNDISQYPNCSPDSAPLLKCTDQALTELGQLSKQQIERRSTTKQSHQHIDNNGRVILVSSFQNEKAVREIIDKFQDILKRKNEWLERAEQNNPSLSVKYSPVNFCDLVIVNTFPIDDAGPTSKISLEFGSSKDTDEFRPKLHIRTFSVKSGRFIGGLLNNLCLEHYNLKSTTITGIPMKEEQNASSSSQYDVEIVHCASIHMAVLDLDANFLNGVAATIDRNGFPCQTFRLNWCTPRNSSVETHHCIATSRITAVDVNSRPSACLTNFLLNGKQVMLEIYKSKSNRMTTHMLASHNGELFIHSFETSRHRLNIGDSPLLGENLGGKVGDYRMNDFVDLMKQHTLMEINHIDDPLNRTLNSIRRQTLYWPVALGHTILLNVPHLLGELLSRISKESMSQSDVEECKRVIDNLVKCESEGQGLPSITMADILKTAGSSKSSNPKLDQLYKLLWNELDYFLRVHSTTPEHESVLDHLLERHVDKSVSRGTKRPSTVKTTTVEANPVKKQKMSSKLLLPELSDPAVTEAAQQTAIFYKTGMTLYQTWAHLYHMFHRSRSKLPFLGRTQPVVLYSTQQGSE